MQYGKKHVNSLVDYYNQCAGPDNGNTFENKVQHTAREYEGRSPSCLGENGDAVADP